MGWMVMTSDRLRREALIKQVQGVIDFYDPFSLRELGAPEDEFEPQARRIVDGRCHDAEGCLNLVWAVFADSFGETAGTKESFADMSNDIFKIVQAGRPQSQTL